MSERILGIDLGTTNSLVAIMERGAPMILTSYEGGRLFPSAVAFTEKGELLVGEHAVRQATMNPKNTLLSVKRLIGRKFYSDEVQKVVEGSPVAIKASERGDPVVTLHGMDFSPEEVTAIILRRLREVAEDYLQEEIRKAVVTVPAYFNFTQREATKNAGRIAHLDVVRVFSEPTAAALAYGLGRSGDRILAIYDLGGGTFDISILEVSQGVFRVLAVSGDNHLGGDDFDAAVVRWMLSHWKWAYGTDLHDNPSALQRMREAAERAKRDLSLGASTTVSLPYLDKGTGTEPLHFNKVLSRAEFDAFVEPLIDRTLLKCAEALQLAGLRTYDVTDLILVGGQTRSPIVYGKVAQFWNKVPMRGIHPEEAVGMGAAIMGGVLAGQWQETTLLDVTGYTVGMEVDGGRILKVIPRSTPLPARVTKVFSTYHDDQDHVRVHVVQGEGEHVSQTRSLVSFDLAPIAPAPAGTPDIEVEFSVDVNGILAVSAMDRRTGQAQNVRLTDAQIHTVQEVESMTSRVDRLMSVEKGRRDLALLRNHAQYLTSRVNAFMSDYCQKIEEGSIFKLTAIISELERVAAFDDPSLLPAARRVIDAQQTTFMGLVKATRASFDVELL